MNNLKFVVQLVGMAQRANSRSFDSILPKDQRDFHAGRREGYLKAIALLSDCEVKDIRRSVLGPPMPVNEGLFHYVPRGNEDLD